MPFSLPHDPELPMIHWKMVGKQSHHYLQINDCCLCVGVFVCVFITYWKRDCYRGV